MHRISKVVAALALVAITATTAEAQMPIAFGVHGGVAIPTGDLGDGANMGYQIGGEIGFSPAMIPVGLRVDVDYTSFGAKEDGVTFSTIGGTLNAMLNLPSAGIAPYVIGGVGLFKPRVSGGGVTVSGDTEFGFQAGAGLRFGLAGMGAGLEAKFVSIQGDGGSWNYIPITLRILFGGN
jgi:hypothetical protein